MSNDFLGFLEKQALEPFQSFSGLIMADQLEESGDLVGADVMRSLSEIGMNIFLLSLMLEIFWGGADLENSEFFHWWDSMGYGIFDKFGHGGQNEGEFVSSSRRFLDRSGQGNGRGDHFIGYEQPYVHPAPPMRLGPLNFMSCGTGNAEAHCARN